MTVVVPDTLGDTRTFLRQDPASLAIHAGRVFFRLPDWVLGPQDSAWTNNGTPVLRLYRTGGGLVPGTETPIDAAVIALECWGGKNSDYPTLRSLAAAVASAFHTAPCGLLTPGGSSWLLNAEATGAIDAPDPETGQPRLVLHAQVRVTLAGPQI